MPQTAILESPAELDEWDEEDEELDTDEDGLALDDTDDDELDEDDDI
ncbi:MAG TPA: hypothetical protein VLJ42_09070 [Solirubrobacteraceae bacterium]|nr:hypothetical protein [Solirubrobacteraceae bacterium]